jgi:hypothetical protein
MAEKVYRSHSPGLRLTGVAGRVVQFVAEGVNEVDVLRRRGRVPRHSGEPHWSLNRGMFRTSDAAVIAELEASPSFGSLFWLEGTR